MGKQLIVIIDEESKKNQELVSRWFPGSEHKTKMRNYTIETPLGKKVKLKGSIIRDPAISECSSEYLYLELTNSCNFMCEHCGVKGNVEHSKSIINKDAEYITNRFVDALFESMKHHQFPGMRRSLFYGGGEPLVNPDKFMRINKKLNKLENTINVVITNGCSLPLDEHGFYDSIMDIGSPQIYFTLSPSHKQQYSLLAEKGKSKRKIPSKVKPGKAIYEKIGIISKYCKNFNIGFTVLNLMDRDYKNKKLEGDLRKHIIERALGETSIYQIENNEKREPCSQGQELAIRTNGDLYPYCTDIFNGYPKIGIIGLLVK